MKAGDQIRLRGITKKGKERLQRDGILWQISASCMSVQCLSGAKGIFIMPLASTINPAKASRWIAVDNDPDFLIVAR